MTVLTGTIQQRYGTAAEWTAENPTLKMAEVGYETDTKKRKTGDGVTEWNNLAYEDGGAGAVSSVNGQTGAVSLDASDVGADPAGSAAAAQSAAQTYADGLVTGLWDDRGSYNASVNTFPAAGGSGTAGAILKGDIWTISVAGTLGGSAVTVGDTVRALSDTPGQTASNWAIAETNIGYVPENSANKDTDGTLAANSDTKYPSQKATKTYVDTVAATKQDRVSALLTGGVITVETIDGTGTLNDIRVTASTYYIEGSGSKSAVQSFLYNFSFCSAGNLKWIDVYGKSDNTISFEIGAEGTSAVHPTPPANSVLFGSVLVTDSGAVSAPANPDYDFPEPVPRIVSTQTHFYSDVYINQTAENYAPVADSWRGNPFFLNEERILDALCIRVSSAATAGTNARFAIYNSLGPDRAYQKLWEGSNFSIATGVATTIVVSGIGLVLQPGLYFALINVSAASGLLRTASNGVSGRLLGYNMSGSQSTAITGLVYNGQSFASAAPSDLSLSVYSIGQGTNVPAIFQGYL